MHKEEAMHWLSYAESALDVARMILGNLRRKTSFLGAASFHAQQAAEKVLKAILIFHQQPFLKTHSIKVLLQLCARVERAFALLIERSYDMLSRYVTQGRYPDIFPLPRPEEAQEALRKAEGLFSPVREKRSSASA